MKVKNKLIEANIENLTSLWKVASTPFDSYFQTLNFEYCEIKNSDWPNKLWFNQDIDQDIITSAKAILQSKPTNFTIPYWNIYKHNSSDLLEKNGFKIQFEQKGMSLKLRAPFRIKCDLNIRLVSNASEAKHWSELFTQSFEYKISSETIVKSFKNINYYIVYRQNQAVGTAISHKTNNIIGVHSVGILPKMRRKGFAEQIMKLLINLAIQDNIDYMTIQASNMGEKMYLKLGFEVLFVIKNYALQQNS